MIENVEMLAFELTAFVLVKATLLLGLVWVVSRMLRQATAPTRYALWAIAFTSLLVMPLLPYLVSTSLLSVLPKFALPLLPARLMVRDVGGAVQTMVGDGGAAPFVPIFAIGMAIWVAGALWQLGRLAGDLLRVRALTAAASDAAAHLHRLGERLRLESGIRRPVRVLSSDQTHVPLTWRHRRPVIVLPASSSEWSVARAEAVLRHELAHVKRSDFLGLMLVEVIRSLYWVNPLAALAARRSRLEQELSCDDAAIRSGISPSSYARHLLDVAREAAFASPPARIALTMAKPSTLKTRVRSILHEGGGSAGQRARAGLAALTIVIAASVCAAGIDPWNCPEQTLVEQITDATRTPA